MATTQLQKNWTITPNRRFPMGSVAGHNSFPQLTAWFFDQIKIAAVAAGWSVWWSSDATTGPSSASDHTYRNAYVDTVTNAVRGSSTTSVQWYLVLQNVDGVQMLIAYQGAFDDDVKISFSVSGSFTLNGTNSKYQPTAADESILFPAVSGASMFEGSGGVDRVVSIGCTNESVWWVIYSANTLRNYIGVEKFDSACDPAVLPKPYLGFRFTSGQTNRTISPGTVVGGISGTSIGALNWSGALIRGTTAGGNMNIPIGGGEVGLPQNFGNSSVGGVPINGSGTKPALQNYAAISLIEINWFGVQVSNLDGYAGKPIDWWIGMGWTTSIPAEGDMISGLDPADPSGTSPRANWLISFGSGVVRAWRNADPSGLVKA